METMLLPRQAAEMLGISEHTLAKWRSKKRYPLRYVKVGGNVRYRMSDLEAFLNSRVMPGVNEPKPALEK